MPINQEALDTDWKNFLASRNAPENFHLLPSEPEQREEFLNRGEWLIVTHAVWSAPDRRAIGVLVSVAASLNPGIQVGIRPFDDFAEFATWLPEVAQTGAAPTWVRLRDGVLLRSTLLTLPPDKIIAFANDDYTPRSVLGVAYS